MVIESSIKHELHKRYKFFLFLLSLFITTNRKMVKTKTGEVFSGIRKNIS